VRWTSVDTEIGPLGLAADDIGLCVVRFDGPPAAAQPQPPTGALTVAAEQLRAYLAGELLIFELPLSVRGGSPFERGVWAQINDIGYGQTRTYGEIARRLGDATAARAVGVACNRNPLPLVVPCHRVVGAGGKLVGFGGGLPRKRRLLDLEARVAIDRGEWG
jgi:methylated-DNA-[protein]-cysteine S-methyltransferase